MKRFKGKLSNKLSNKLSGKLSNPLKLSLKREGLQNDILTLGLFVFVIITTFWLIDIVFGLLSDSMNFSEIKYVLLLIRDYILWFVLALLYILIAKKKQFNNQSAIGFTALGSLYTAVKLYMADLGAIWILIVEWIIITMAIYNIVRIIFSRLSKPATD